jgi:hypothetical protein
MQVLKRSFLQKQRPAIAMIELIFSLVVMGITLMSAPMLIERASKSSYVTLQQESITAGATQLSMIMTAGWDHSDVNSTSEYIPVLTTQSGAVTSPAIANCTSDNPPGVSSSSGRYCRDSTTTSFYPATAIALDSNHADIDDYNGFSQAINKTVDLYNSETAVSDYIDKNITITSNVYYGVDTPMKKDGTASAGGYDQGITFSNPFRTSSTTTTHIKLITITLTSNNPAAELNTKNIFLSAFMCNVGAPKALESNKVGL